MILKIDLAMDAAGRLDQYGFYLKGHLVMVSHKDKCIFIHIPKTGGESIASLFDDVDPAIPKHANARQISDYLGKDRFEDYFKFTFVRNPWDQAVSMYFHLRKPLYQRETILKKYGQDILNPVRACQIACRHNFRDYCQLVYAQKQKQEEEERAQWPVRHFAPFVEWISDAAGNIITDHIGRFERLHSDTQEILEKLGKGKIDLPRKNRSRHEHYAVYYDSPSRAVIAAHYARDIQAFAYQFEGPSGGLGG